MRPVDRQDWGDKAFRGIRSGDRERSLFDRFLESTDYSPSSRRAVAGDLRAFMTWFNERNGEAFVLERVTARDITDFRSYLREERGLAVATVNRALVLIRRLFGWLVEQGELLAVIHPGFEPLLVGRGRLQLPGVACVVVDDRCGSGRCGESLPAHP